MIAGRVVANDVALVVAVLIMAGSAWLAKHSLPLFFQNVYGGFVATLPGRGISVRL